MKNTISFNDMVKFVNTVVDYTVDNGYSWYQPVFNYCVQTFYYEKDFGDKTIQELYDNNELNVQPIQNKQLDEIKVAIDKEIQLKNSIKVAEDILPATDIAVSAIATQVIGVMKKIEKVIGDIKPEDVKKIVDNFSSASETLAKAKSKIKK